MGLCIANLVTTLQRSFPYIVLPPPDLVYFIAILYVDDFALLASTRAQLLALMQLTQTWCENNASSLHMKSARSSSSIRPPPSAASGRASPGPH
jgi:hypothetical protein